MLDKWADRIKKIPLIFFVIFFFCISIANLIVLDVTIISVGGVCIVFLMILLCSFFVLLFKFQKTRLFFTLGINEFLLFLWSPSILFLFFVINYSIASTEYEGTVSTNELEILQLEDGRYIVYIQEIPMTYNLELSVYYSDVNFGTDEIKYCFKKGIFGYTIFQKEIIEH